jgi:hypothetical protein
VGGIELGCVAYAKDNIGLALSLLCIGTFRIQLQAKYNSASKSIFLGKN